MVNYHQGHTLTFVLCSDVVEPVVRVTYQTRPAEKEADGPLILVRQVTPLLSDDEEEEQEDILCRRVAGLEISYLTAGEEELEAWERKDLLPAAVKIKLELDQGQGQVSVFERLTGPLTSLSWKRGS